MNVMGSVKKFSLGGMFIGAMVVASSLTFTGCLTDDKEEPAPTDTAKHTAFGTETTLSVGGQGHTTLGSVLELDAGKVLTSVQANADQANIDGVLLYYAGAWHLENAVMAKASGVANAINLTNTYDATKIEDISYVKVATMPADQEAALKAFDAGPSISGSVITGGEIFLINTTGGNIVVLKVKSVTGTTSAGVGDFTFSVLSI